MTAAVKTAHGVYVVDVDAGEIVELTANGELSTAPQPQLSLPRVVMSAAAGSTVVALVDRRPPLAVSYDAGRTWSEAGRGLPAGRAVAVFEDDPDLVLYAARNRLYVSRDGGRFWRSVAVELPEIEAVSWFRA